jgi:hypothetical protein
VSGSPFGPESKETYYFETTSGSAIVAPNMSLHFFNPTGPHGFVRKAWLECVR